MPRRKSLRLLWLTGLSAAVLGIVLISRTGWRPEIGVEAQGRVHDKDNTALAKEDRSGPGERTSELLGDLDAAQHGQRLEALTPTLMGRVYSEVGGELENATATWAPWRNLDLYSQTPWWSAQHFRGWQAIDAEVDGVTYAFWDRPLGDPESYVYVTDPNYFAAAVRVEEDRAEPLTLAPAFQVSVRTTDDSGRAVEGAVITSLGWLPLGDEIVPLLRHYRADAEGSVTIDPLPNTSILHARHEGRASATWQGSHSEVESPVTLVLHDTFSAGGRVVGCPSQDDLGRCEVLIRRAHGEDTWAREPAEWFKRISSTPVSQDGTWEHTSVAWLGEGNYVFRLQGPTTSPLEVVQAVSSPGQRVSIDFNWSDGYQLELRLMDEDEVPIPSALVVAAWKGNNGAWTRYDTTSNSEGLALFTNCPPVTLWVRAYAKGYANQAFGPFTIPVESGSFPLVLERSGEIRGTCTHGGDPVDQFTVTYWGEDPTGRSAVTFDSTDGTFELTDVPRGTVHLFARSDEFPSSPILTVEGTQEEGIELKLSDPTVARGKVVDSSTGEPLHRARLAVHAHFGSRILEEWGSPMYTDAAGAFSGLVLSSSTDSIEVSLDTYSTTYATCDGTSGEVDLGLIALTRVQDLTVQLVSARPMSFEGFLVGLMNESAEEVDAQGRIVLKGVQPQGNVLFVYPPSGGRIDVDLALVAGRSWKYEVLVGSQRTVVVSLDPAEEVEVPEDLWVGISYRDRVGNTHRCIVPLDENGVSRLDHISGDQAVIQAVTSSGLVIATKAVALPETSEVRVTLPLSGWEVELQFLDSQDLPVPSARVFIRLPDDPVACEIAMKTDSLGRVRLVGFQGDEIDVRVSPDYFKHAATQRVRLLEEGPTIVRVDLGSRVRALLIEHGLPVAGLRVAVLEVGETMRAVVGNSDSNGLVDLPYLSAGSYQLRIEGDGYWTNSYPVEASPDPAPQEIEVRRIGSVELRVTQESLPVHGLQLEVISNEDACSVAEWLESGLALSGEQGLVTDSTGTVVLKGLPNGSYTWRIQTGSGTVQGQFEVAPLKLTHVPIALPP